MLRLVMVVAAAAVGGGGDSVVVVGGGGDVVVVAAMAVEDGCVCDLGWVVVVVVAGVRVCAGRWGSGV